MTIMELGAIGELVGGFAVVATLAYLALQVRHSAAQLNQTTTAISSSAFHGITALVVPLHTALVADRGICDLMVRARSGLGSLDDTDRYRFNLCASMVFRVLDDIYEYHRSGLMDQSQWDNWEVLVRENLASRGMREYWQGNAGSFTASFQQIIGPALEKREGA
jgi:hypothetical protein